MEETELKNSVGDSVIEAIKSGRARMRSKWYFRLRNLLITVALIILILAAVFLASFVIFVLHGQSIWFVPLFGLSGWYGLFNSLPVILVVFSMVFIAILALFVKLYPQGYQWPLVYSMLGIFFLILATTAWFVQTSVYQEFFGLSSVSATIPFLGQYYPGLGILTADDVHRGQIVSFNAGGFELRANDGTRVAVLVTSSTTLPTEASFAAGDNVVVFGVKNTNGAIRAVGVQKIQQ